MEPLSQTQRFEVLTAQLSERYEVAHKIRERGTQFTLWISGMGIGVAWILIQGVTLSLSQKISMTGLVLSLAFATWVILKGQAIGLSNTLKVQSRLEAALGLFDKGPDEDRESILPPGYAKAGQGSPWSAHYKGLLRWTSLLVASLIALTWACPVPKEVDTQNQVSLSQVKGGR